MTDTAFAGAARGTAPAPAAAGSGELVAFSKLMERAHEALAAAVARAEAEQKRADRLQAELDALGDRLGIVVRAAADAERKRISELADRTGAVCSSDEGTSFYFSALLAEVPGA